jgi:MoaA/NifB/PqqE/SkfB family radical SAM enzyme
MKSSLSEERSAGQKKTYFCSEPWIGIFSVETNQDVTFCPCYLKLKLGNLNEASMKEIWNAEPLIQIRRSFQQGELPEACREQLCSVALGKEL